MSAKSKLSRVWSHTALWMGALVALVSWGWQSDAHSYTVRKKTQNHMYKLVQTSQLHTYPLSRVAGRCDVRYTPAYRAIHRELRLKYLVKGQDHCRRRKYAL